MSNPSTTNQPQAFELRFQSLFDTDKALAFPCTANGEVDLDTLSECARRDYLFARAVVGRLFEWPAVRLVTLH